MACTNCSTDTSLSIPKGCGSNGSCGTDSCNKLNVFDWLSNMHYPPGFEAFDVVEVRFKNGRKDFYKNTEKLALQIGDVVATEALPGHDIGIITLTGELVRVQMKKKKTDYDNVALRIYRKANQKDIDVWQEARSKEEAVRVRARELAIFHRLEMKISDVEFQGDASKATFYYTANDRVDFRQLIKDYAKEFSIRIEMKQIGFRQEATRLGGIGSCGRELCCSTWLTDFRSVNTSVARYQQLSLNPQKLAGQCGKLKCCLNYELDTYLDALKDLPDMDTKLQTEKGIMHCQKIDIFKRVMWFAYPENSANWYKISVEKVKDIITANQTGEKIENIEDFVSENQQSNEKTITFDEDNLSRFDNEKRKKRPAKKGGNRNKNGKTQPRNEEGKTARTNQKVSNKFADRSSSKTNEKPVNKTGDRPMQKSTERPTQKSNEVQKTGEDDRRAVHKKKRNPNYKGKNRNNNSSSNHEAKPQ